MAQNMNTQLMALCQEIYEQDGLAAVRDLAKQIAPWCKERVEMEKRGAAEAKLQAAEQKKLDLIGKAQDKPRKALIRELRKNETFKQLKTQIADAEKAARKAAADAKKLAAAEAKANKPTKVTKAWAKLFDKSVKKVEVDAKKVATQLKALVTLKKKAVAKAAKEAAAQAKKDAAEAKKKAAAKPTKVDAAMIKRWNKVLTKGIKRGETDTKKALAQLKQLKTKKVQADAKAAKEAAKAAKKAEPKAKKTKKKAVEEAAVGDDLIATLLAKANETGPEPAVAKPAPEPAVAKPAPEPAVAKPAPEPVAELAPEPVEEEEDVAVVRFEHDGVKYLKDNEGYLYDPETQEEVGFWNGSEVEELEDM
jgi:colicin import membrane protein